VTSEVIGWLTFGTLGSTAEGESFFVIGMSLAALRVSLTRQELSWPERRAKPVVRPSPDRKEGNKMGQSKGEPSMETSNAEHDNARAE
jgi:hypothetical protein